MTSRFAGFALLAALAAISVFPQTTSASPHLVIPHSSSSAGDHAYLEVNNTNDHEVSRELTAFGSFGQVLGAARLTAPPQERVRVPLREAFAFREGLTSG